MGQARPMSGSPGFVVDGVHDGQQARLRPIREGVYALAALASPGTFPVEIELDTATLQSLVEHAQAMLIATPRFPAGTPEHDAYAAELRAELAKWAAGVEPYPYRD
jgi:hypothetical protein